MTFPAVRRALRLTKLVVVWAPYKDGRSKTPALPEKISTPASSAMTSLPHMS
jgi:hypothetical protein